MDRERIVTVSVLPGQRYVCPPCAAENQENVASQETLRVAAETACCALCGRYDTWQAH
jgi:hypothetical protein